MGILFAVLSALGYSASYILVQLGLRKSKSHNGDFLSLFAAMITVAALYMAMNLFGDSKTEEFNWLGILFFASAGFFTAFLGRAFIFMGIRRIGSSRTVAIKNSAPVFTVLIAILFMHERISLWGGIGMAMIFVTLIEQARYDFKRPLLASQTDNKVGLILSFIAAICFGIGQAARKQGLVYFAEPIMGSLIGSAFALLMFILIRLSKRDFSFVQKTELALPNLYFIGAGVITGFAQLSFFFSLMFTKLSYTSVVAAMEPIITIILGIFFLEKEENITLRLGVTAGIVFLGTIIIIFTGK